MCVGVGGVGGERVKLINYCSVLKYNLQPSVNSTWGTCSVRWLKGPTNCCWNTTGVSDAIFSCIHGWTIHYNWSLTTLKFRHQPILELVSHLESYSECMSLLQASRYTKKQVFFLHGDTSKVLRIKNSTVSYYYALLIPSYIKSTLSSSAIKKWLLC